MQTCCGHLCCCRVSTKEHATSGLHGCLPGCDGSGEADSMGRVLASGAVGAVASIRFPGQGGGGVGSLCLAPDPVHPDRSWKEKLDPGRGSFTWGRGKGCDIAAACPAPPGGPCPVPRPRSLRRDWRRSLSSVPPQSRCRKRPPPKAACAPGMAASPPRAQES